MDSGERSRPEPDDPNQIITASEAARVKGVDRTAVYLAIKTGRLKAYRSGRTWMVRRGDLDDWEIIGHRPRRKPGP